MAQNEADLFIARPGGRSARGRGVTRRGRGVHFIQYTQPGGATSSPNCLHLLPICLKVKCQGVSYRVIGCWGHLTPLTLTLWTSYICNGKHRELKLVWYTNCLIAEFFLFYFFFAFLLLLKMKLIKQQIVKRLDVVNPWVMSNDVQCMGTFRMY